MLQLKTMLHTIMGQQFRWSVNHKGVSTMLKLHLKSQSKYNPKKIGLVYKNEYQNCKSFITKVYNDERLISTYYTNSEIEAIQEVQLSLMGE